MANKIKKSKIVYKDTMCGAQINIDTTFLN